MYIILLNILFYIYSAVSIILAVILLFPLFIHLISLLKAKQSPSSNYGADENYFAILVSSYKNVNIARPLINSLLAQEYENFHIFLIADDSRDTLNIESEKLTVLYPEISLHSKVQSLKKGIDLIETNKQFTHTLILDEDNQVDRNYLLQLNQRTHEGHRVIQTERIAKNHDTNIAKIDAGLEVYHNYVDKVLPFKLVNSSLLSGSGIAIETKLLKTLLLNILNENPSRSIFLGEDKMMQFMLHTQNINICYASEIKTLDEKVTRRSILQNQRSRWYASYFENLPNAWKTVRSGLVSLKSQNILLGLIVSYPPITLLLIGTTIWLLIGVSVLHPYSILVITSTILFILHFFLVLLIKGTKWRVVCSFWVAPLFMITQFLSLLNMKKTKKDFLYTQKKQTTEETNQSNNNLLID